MHSTCISSVTDFYSGPAKRERSNGKLHPNHFTPTYIDQPCSGEEKPRCLNCERQGETCDYSIRLNWGGHTKRNPDNTGSTASSATNSPYEATFSFESNASPLFPPALPEAPVSPANFIYHSRSKSATSVPTSDVPMIDPDLVTMSQAPSQSTLCPTSPFGHNHSFSQEISFDSSRGLQVPPANEGQYKKNP